MLKKYKKMILFIVLFFALLIGLSFLLPSKTMYQRVQDANDVLEELTPIITAVSPVAGAAFEAGEKALDKIQELTDEEDHTKKEAKKDE